MLGTDGVSNQIPTCLQQILHSQMEIISLFLLTLIAALAVTFFISKLIKIQRRPVHKLRPPGPKPWPIIGNLNLLGLIPHQSLHHLSQKYGEIMQLKFGNFPVVIASSPKMAEQFLKVHDSVFASRPPVSAGKHISYDYSDISFAPYGPYWREARKLVMLELFGPRKLESFNHIRVEEMRRFLSHLKSLSPKPVLLRDHLLDFTLFTMCRMVISDNFFDESEKERSKINSDTHDLRDMMKEWFFLNGVFNIGDWIPWLDFLDLDGYVKKMKDLRRRTDKFFGRVIDDHLARRENIAGSDNAHEEKQHTTILDALVQMAEDCNCHGEVQITMDCVKALTMCLILGGPDTLATVVEWAVYEMLRQPRIIEKAKEEVKRVMGKNRWVEESDFSELPYIDAILMETFRLHPVGTLLGAHYAMRDCIVEGYNISKGTTVIINTWSIGRDPNSWDEVEEFLPERFMGKQTDMTGSNFALLPFGSGRRRCPAYNLGLKNVRTTLANLVHGFELKLVEGMRPQDISMEEKYGFATIPKHPLSIVMEPTLPAHLYY